MQQISLEHFMRICRRMANPHEGLASRKHGISLCFSALRNAAYAPGRLFHKLLFILLFSECSDVSGRPIMPARHLRTHEKRCSRALPFNPNHPAGKCPAISICASTQENIARGFPAHQEGGLKEIPSAACGIRIATSMVWGVACTRLVSAAKGDIPLPLLKAMSGHRKDMDTLGSYGHEVTGDMQHR